MDGTGPRSGGRSTFSLKAFLFCPQQDTIPDAPFNLSSVPDLFSSVSLAPTISPRPKARATRFLAQATLSPPSRQTEPKSKSTSNRSNPSSALGAPYQFFALRGQLGPTAHLPPPEGASTSTRLVSQPKFQSRSSRPIPCKTCTNRSNHHFIG